MQPRFWRHGEAGVLPRLLFPASLAVARITARRLARPGWRAPVPVICCGNAGVGGAGKTTLALDLAARLAARGARPHFLTRGHGGHLPGPLRVTPQHDAVQVGDEALLLAGGAPCWIGADRATTARLATQAGATVLILDDGLQNPTLVQDHRLLVIDGAAGFGNGRVLPAGPLREPAEVAASRATAAILIGADQTGALTRLPPDLPVLSAHLSPAQEIAHFAGRKLVAFAGIGRPAKFFDMLTGAGLHLAATLPFPDHHRFTPRDLARLHASAAHHGAQLITTPKDHVRLPQAARAGIAAIGVTLVWEDQAALGRLLDQMIAA